MIEILDEVEDASHAAEMRQLRYEQLVADCGDDEVLDEVLDEYLEEDWEEQKKEDDDFPPGYWDWD